MQILRCELQRLNVHQIVVHANHFKNNRKQISELFKTALFDIDILVENNGFDDLWGYSQEGLTQIFKDCPEVKLCLDIAHVKDLTTLKLNELLKNEIFSTRIGQIHYSYATRQLGYDPYDVKGYPGYGPHHALLSLIDQTPSPETKDFVRKYPVVIEGLVPSEDSELEFLSKEIESLCN